MSQELIKIYTFNGNYTFCFVLISIFETYQRKSILYVFMFLLSRSFKSVQSVRNYLSGVKTLPAILDIDFPKDNIFQLNLLLRGISREKQHIPRQDVPITPVIL